MNKSLVINVFLVFGLLQSSMAQCDTLRHNVTWFDGWISCEETANPNPVHNAGHWIMYDFSQPFALHEMRVWNMNASEYTDYGLQNVVIDISSDGTTWTEHGQYVFPQGTGDPRYEGIEVMNFDSATARFVLITAINNYGGDCYGLSEIRIRGEELCEGDAVKWIAGNGDWSIAANWCRNKIPTLEDQVIIPEGITVTVPAFYTAFAQNVQLRTGAELDLVGRLIVEVE